MNMESVLEELSSYARMSEARIISYKRLLAEISEPDGEPCNPERDNVCLAELGMTWEKWRKEWKRLCRQNLNDEEHYLKKIVLEIKTEKLGITASYSKFMGFKL